MVIAMTMTYKERVKKFMRRKDEIIFEATELHIFDEHLFDQTISEETCQEMVINLIDRRPFNVTLCPWCVQHRDCNVCGFGYKYGVCDEYDSRYQIILSKLNRQTDFYNLPGMKEEVEELCKS